MSFNSNLDKIQAKYESLSLDEIIRKNNDEASKQKSQSALYTKHYTGHQMLDDYVRDAQVKDAEEDSQRSGKFNRRSMLDNMSDDDDEIERTEKVNNAEDDLLEELEEAAKFVEKSRSEELDRFYIDTQPSTTVSDYEPNPTPSRSNQRDNRNSAWRGPMNNQNRRHSTNPYNDVMRPNTFGGRVTKKGSFTYKYGDRQNRVLGIERAGNQRFPAPRNIPVHVTQQQVQPININVNLDGLLEGLACKYQQMRDPAPARPSTPTSFAATSSSYSKYAKPDAALQLIKALRKSRDIKGRHQSQQLLDIPINQEADDFQSRIASSINVSFGDTQCSEPMPKLNLRFA